MERLSGNTENRSLVRSLIGVLGLALAASACNLQMKISRGTSTSIVAQATPFEFQFRTIDGPGPLKDVITGSDWREFNGVVFASLEVGGSGRHLYRLGADQRWTQALDLTPSFSDQAQILAHSPQALYFTAFDGVSGRQKLFRLKSDFSVEKACDLNPGSSDNIDVAKMQTFTSVWSRTKVIDSLGRYYFVTQAGSLWRTGAPGTSACTQIEVGGANSFGNALNQINVFSLTEDDTLFYAKNLTANINNFKWFRLATTDGAPVQVSNIRTNNPDMAINTSNTTAIFGVASDALYYWGFTATGLRRVFRLRTASGSPTQVSNINGGGENNNYGVIPFGANTLFFMTMDAAFVPSLFRIRNSESAFTKITLANSGTPSQPFIFGTKLCVIVTAAPLSHVECMEESDAATTTAFPGFTNRLAYALTTSNAIYLLAGRPSDYYALYRTPAIGTTPTSIATTATPEREYLDRVMSVGTTDYITWAPSVSSTQQYWRLGKFTVGDTLLSSASVTPLNNKADTQFSNPHTTQSAVYFNASDANGITRLYRVKNGSTTAELIQPIRPTRGDDLLSNCCVAVGDDFYFVMNSVDAASPVRRKLYKVSLNSTVPQLVSDTNPGADDAPKVARSTPQHLYYQSKNSSGYDKLHRLNLSTGVVTQVANLSGSSANDNYYISSWSIGVLGSYLYFAGDNASGFFKLFRIADSESAPTQVSNVNPAGHDDINEVQETKQNIIVLLSDDSRRINNSETGLTLILDSHLGNSDSAYDLSRGNECAYFASFDSSWNYDIYSYCDGDATAQKIDTYPGGDDWLVGPVQFANGHAYFKANNANGKKLFAVKDRTTTPIVVSQYRPTGDDGLSRYAVFRDKVYFTVQTDLANFNSSKIYTLSTRDAELGLGQNATLLTDLSPGLGDSPSLLGSTSQKLIISGVAQHCSGQYWLYQDGGL